MYYVPTLYYCTECITTTVYDSLYIKGFKLFRITLQIYTYIYTFFLMKKYYDNNVTIS